MGLVKRMINTEDHLGIETGPLEAEQVSLSGRHNEIVDGTFNLSVNFGSQNYQSQKQNMSLPGQTNMWW